MPTRLEYFPDDREVIVGHPIFAKKVFEKAVEEDLDYVLDPWVRPGWIYRINANRIRLEPA